MKSKSTNGTAQKLIQVSIPLFAAKGFYGTSIRDISRALSIAKSSLLHHFESKEKLYGAVLKVIADEMTREISDIRTRFPGEVEQMKQVAGLLCSNSAGRSDRDFIILREMLDNVERAETSRQWYFSAYLNELVEIVKNGSSKGLFKPVNPGTFILHLLGAHNYFIMSQPTVRHLFDPETFQKMKDDHRGELYKIIQDRLMVNPDDFKED